MHRKLWWCRALVGLTMILATAPAWSAPAQEKAIEQLVAEAADLVQKQGQAALAQFSQPGSRWFNDQHQLFVFDEKGNELVNPRFPELVGKNLWDLQDMPGRYLAREQLALVQAKGAGWMETMWAKPGGGPAAKTRTYVKGARMGAQLVVIGSWYYVD